MLPVFLIATAVPMTVSRSGVLGLVVGMGVASIAWDWRRRLNVAVAGVFFLMAMRLVVPGLLGTLRSLIVGAENDPSVQGRLADLVFVRQYVAETPVLGRGPGTFNPIQYFFLDNQLYGTWISSGFIGLLALLVLVATGIVVSARAGKHLDDESRSLGYAVAASIAVAGVSMATFDGEAFHIYNGTLFVLLGSAGAFWRLTIGHRRQFVLAAGHGE